MRRPRYPSATGRICADLRKLTRNHVPSKELCGTCRQRLHPEYMGDHKLVELSSGCCSWHRHSIERLIELSEIFLSEAKVIGDINQLRFLIENLIDEALSFHQDGELVLKAIMDGEYVRFLFTDRRREKQVEELNQLFYPNLARMTSGEKGELRGTEYLICKQIIRDHDEFAGRRGCRINAEPAQGGGFTVYFTVPKR